MKTAKGFSRALKAAGEPPAAAALLCAVFDADEVFCHTEETLEAWWASLPPERKAEIYEADLEGEIPGQISAAPEASEMRQLERSIAYERAVSIIDSNLPRGHDWRVWFNVAEVDELAEPDIQDAIRYLDLRGLIERDPEHPSWISIRDESEADENFTHLSPTHQEN